MGLKLDNEKDELQQSTHYHDAHKTDNQTRARLRRIATHAKSGPIELHKQKGTDEPISADHDAAPGGNVARFGLRRLYLRWECLVAWFNCWSIYSANFTANDANIAATK